MFLLFFLKFSHNVFFSTILLTQRHIIMQDTMSCRLISSVAGIKQLF